jgi:hypothetical protein
MTVDYFTFFSFPDQICIYSFFFGVNVFSALFLLDLYSDTTFSIAYHFMFHTRQEIVKCHDSTYYPFLNVHKQYLFNLLLSNIHKVEQLLCDQVCREMLAEWGNGSGHSPDVW